ncbi:hypothetical protein D3C86_1115620 [compost metagenome]
MPRSAIETASASAGVSTFRTAVRAATTRRAKMGAFLAVLFVGLMPWRLAATGPMPGM